MRLLIASGLLCLIVLPTGPSEIKVPELRSAGAPANDDPAPAIAMESAAPADADVPDAEDAPKIEKDQDRILPEVIVKTVVYRPIAEVCDAVERAAKSNNLPVAFFIRLLHQESGFRPGVVSSAGAQGVAQFMPEVAARMGVENPFDPLEAIPASARLLKTLLAQFGNIGLAAAAYNAGPKRIQTWLTAKKATLPKETQGYVRSITGKPVENWRSVTKLVPDPRPAGRAPCKAPADGHMLVAEHVEPPKTTAKTKLARAAGHVARALKKIPAVKTRMASKERPALTSAKHVAVKTRVVQDLRKRPGAKPVELARRAGKSRSVKVAAR